MWHIQINITNIRVGHVCFFGFNTKGVLYPLSTTQTADMTRDLHNSVVGFTDLSN
jgi:hypothetical protein